MVFYNVRRSNDFFTILSACKGKIDIVGSDGQLVEYKKSRELPDGSAHNCFDGMIRHIELKFDDAEDLERMLSYIMNEKRSA